VEAWKREWGGVAESRTSNARLRTLNVQRDRFERAWRKSRRGCGFFVDLFRKKTLPKLNSALSQERDSQTAVGSALLREVERVDVLYCKPACYGLGHPS
jgi:hypothetical protein